MSKQYGDFMPGQKAFKITQRDIPRNWYNYIWNDSFISFVSQAGVGRAFLQDELGNRVHCLTERGMYLLEEGAHWGLIGMPVDEHLDAYDCVHGLGYTRITTQNRRIRSEVCVFVPCEDSCEAVLVTLTNESDRKRTVRLLAYTGHEMDGAYALQGYNTDRAAFDPDCGGMVYKGHKDSFGGKKHVDYYGFTLMNPQPDGYDGARNAFVGVYDSLALPKAVKRGGCTNTDGVGEKLAAALQKDISLEPGQTVQMVLLCGVAFSKEAICALREKYATAERYHGQLDRVKEKFLRQTEQVCIVTPDEKLNEMFHWLKHQTNMGSQWARVRHNGYRDMLSDTECLAAFNPALALERLVHILTYQYSNGYAPRTIQNGAIRDNNFSDNAVWITFTAMAILKELGDVSILDRVTPFNDGSEATLYEHIRRSVEFLYNFRGLHGLIRIWGGDWNDCMNSAGLQGKGVSVWLSLAWLRANKMFREIACIYGKMEDASLAEKRTEEMQNIIEKCGWDGEYYLDAYNDQGVKIGSSESREGKIFLIPQLWAVLSGVSCRGREVAAMDAVEKYLRDPLGTRICYPAYTKHDPDIGTVTLKSPGIHENGGVYLHTLAWKIAADAILKRADRVEADIEAILPFRNPVVDGRAEPYIMCNSYFGEQTGYRYGTPGQSWRTAAGQWFQMALIRYVYGLQPEMNGLRIDPCLPPAWKHAEITKQFRNTTYHIRYENDGTHVRQILADGKPIEGTLVPRTDKTLVEITVITDTL